MRWAAVVAFAFLLVCMGPGGVRADEDLFVVGQSLASWRVVHQQRHAEFVRVYFRDSSEAEFGVEIIADDASAAEWHTGRHRLMPAPGSNPPIELLREVMRVLQEFEEGQQGTLVNARASGRESRPLSREPRRNMSLVWLLLAALAMWHPWLRGRGSESSDPTSVDATRQRVWLPFGITLLAIVLRLPLLQRGVLSDELAWMFSRDLDEILWGVETAINPPLLRLLFNLPFDPQWSLIAARCWSLIASSLAVPMLFHIGRVMGASLISSSFGALALAVFPLAIMQAGWYRSYATWLLLASWHCLTVVQIARHGERARWTVQLALSALLLAQVHYFSVPMLLFEGVLLAWHFRSVRFLALYVPAALGFLTWVPVILTDTTKLQPPDQIAGVVSHIGEITSMGLQAPASLLVCLAVPVLLWRRLDSPRRALLLCSVAVLAGAVVIAPGHLVRPDAGIFALPFVLPLLSSLPDLLQPISLRVVAWISLAGLFLAVVGPDLRDPYLPREPDAMLEFAREWTPDGDGSPVFVHPEQGVYILAWSLDRKILDEECEWRGYPCYRRSQAELFVGLPEAVLPEPGSLVTPRYGRAPTLPGGRCDLAREGSAYRLWSCD